MEKGARQRIQSYAVESVNTQDVINDLTKAEKLREDSHNLRMAKNKSHDVRTKSVGPIHSLM